MADPAAAERGLPLVAVVGRPNVGKSSLVNRVLGRREAIVEETPGVTRDRRSFVAEWAGRRFEIVDTGGLEPGAKGLAARVAEQAEVAMEAADLIVFVVDATAGPLEDDMIVAAKLRGGDKPVLVVANKVDDPRDEADATRAASPLARARDAHEVDTTGLTLDEVVERMEQEVRRRL